MLHWLGLEIGFVNEAYFADITTILTVQLGEVILEVLEKYIAIVQLEGFPTKSTRQWSLCFCRPDLACVDFHARWRADTQSRHLLGDRREAHPIAGSQWTYNAIRHFGRDIDRCALALSNLCRGIIVWITLDSFEVLMWRMPSDAFPTA